MLFVVGILIIMAYLGGLLFMLRMPTWLGTAVAAEAANEVEGALRMTYLSNRWLLVYCVVGLLVVLVATSVLLVATARRYNGHRGAIVGRSIVLGLLVFGFTGGLSFLMLGSEGIPELAAGAKADMALYEAGEGIVYEGHVGTRGLATYAGAYYTEKPEIFYELRILEDGGWTSVYCPVGLAQASGAAGIKESTAPGDSFVLSYLPGTRIVTQIRPKGGVGAASGLPA